MDDTGRKPGCICVQATMVGLRFRLTAAGGWLEGVLRIRRERGADDGGGLIVR